MYAHDHFYLPLLDCLQLFHILPELQSFKMQKKASRCFKNTELTKKCILNVFNAVLTYKSQNYSCFLSQQNAIVNLCSETVIQCNIKSFSAVLMAIQSSLAFFLTKLLRLLFFFLSNMKPSLLLLCW